MKDFEWIIEYEYYLAKIYKNIIKNNKSLDSNPFTCVQFTIF